LQVSLWIQWNKSTENGPDLGGERNEESFTYAYRRIGGSSTKASEGKYPAYDVYGREWVACSKIKGILTKTPTVVLSFFLLFLKFNLRYYYI